MRAVVVSRHGGPKVLVPAEQPDPRPGPGEVAVELAAIGINYHDIYERSGLYTRDLPYIPGREAAGFVVSKGDGVTNVAVGDAVVSVDVPCAYAERAQVAADRLLLVPEGIPVDMAAAVLLQGLTAHYLTRASYAVQPGDTVLVHAAAGGTGQILTQFVKLLGGRVIGTVSTAGKERIAREAGVDEVIRYDDNDFAAAVRRLTGGEGVSAVYDAVGRDTFAGSLRSLSRCGTLVLYGQASGKVPTFEPSRLSEGSLSLTRPMLPDYIVTPQQLRDRANQVLAMVAEGKLTVRIGGRYGLADARAAHEDLEGRRTTGKLLLIP